MQAKHVLWIILLLALAVRLPALTHLVYGDEYRFVPGAMPTNHIGLIENFEMPPLPTWMNQLFGTFIPDATLATRLASLLFGMLNIWLVYLIGKRMYDEKAGLWAAGLFAFSVYAVWASVAVELNGVNMLFAFLLAMYAMISLDKTKDVKWLYIFGIAGGIGMLSRYECFLFYPLLLLDQWYYHKDWKLAIKRCLIAGLITTAIFAIFPILSFATKSNHFYSTIERGANMTMKTLQEFHIMPYVVQLLYALLWVALPFGALFIMGIKKYEKAHFRWYVWVVLLILFYTLFVNDNFSPFDRYFTLLMPAFLFIGLSKVTVKKPKGWWQSFAFFSILMLVMVVGANQTQEQLPFYPKEAYVQRAMSLDWQFLIPFNGGSGPIGFLASFSSIALAFIIASLAVIAYWVLPHKETTLALLLATSLVLNVYLIEEFAYGTTHPNINQVTKHTIDYVKETTPTDQHLYFFRNWALKLYLDEYEKTNLDFFNDTSINAGYLQSEFKKGGTIMWVDFPPINKQGPLWEAVNTCTKETSFYSQGVETGMVFRCNPGP
ncbi:MAG: glycosyltransferase family 39 protein [Candidatus Woesearchaeota archaeon]|jgi:hypothetical protein|nr:glycosyltransferase family 39 protein [Candidatus Woesearchaeota archaeon]MDP7198393.1 glycosyltransferase family 39 protein [Candidatus Woesearchaeota archaeon]MDP7467495.1 glycosyltransferase family 39 protein [Candidatus Woesearchaeota archaeon]MDP7647722.1 glycosyltransferase family 39 protein [Candidatus Woesearchaeota archaeon]